jgi:hypothetical protein
MPRSASAVRGAQSTVKTSLERLAAQGDDADGGGAASPANAAVARPASVSSDKTCGLIKRI